MRQTDDVSRGAWIRRRLRHWTTILGFVPSGFEAYARVPHPDPGWMPSADLARTVSVLRRHSSTPDAGTAALWEGWGWLHGTSGTSVAVATDATDPAAIARIVAEARADVERDPLPDAGARLSLPGRDYLLFDTDLAELTRADWHAASGWDPNSSPNLLWPDDRAWCLASEIDLDSTLIAGSRALVDDLLKASGLEAVEIPPGASLQRDADTLEGPRSLR